MWWIGPTKAAIRGICERVAPQAVLTCGSSALGTLRGKRCCTVSDPRVNPRLIISSSVLEPGDDAIEHIKLMFLFAEAVTFTRIKHKIGFHTIAFQAPIKLLALADRIGAIIFTLQDQGRRARILDIGDRRTLDEAVELFIWSAEEPLVIT